MVLRISLILVSLTLSFSYSFAMKLVTDVSISNATHPLSELTSESVRLCDEYPVRAKAYREFGATIDVNKSSFQLDSGSDETPLHRACHYQITDQFSPLEVVAILLAKGARIDLQNSHEQTPIDVAIHQGDNDEEVALLLFAAWPAIPSDKAEEFLRLATSKVPLNAIDTLLHGDRPIPALPGEITKNLVYHATRNNKTKVIERLLKEHLLTITEEDQKGVLNCAAKRTHHTLVRFLLDKYTYSIKALTSALHEVTMSHDGNDHLTIMRWLHQKGADPDGICDPYCFTRPMDRLLCNFSDYKDGKRCVERVELLLELGVCLESMNKKTGRTALLTTSCDAKLEPEFNYAVVKELLKRGAHYLAQDNKGCTVLHLVRSSDLLRLLYGLHEHFQEQLMHELLLEKKEKQCLRRVITVLLIFRRYRVPKPVAVMILLRNHALMRDIAIMILTQQVIPPMPNAITAQIPDDLPFRCRIEDQVAWQLEKTLLDLKMPLTEIQPTCTAELIQSFILKPEIQNPEFGKTYFFHMSRALFIKLAAEPIKALLLIEDSSGKTAYDCSFERDYPEKLLLNPLLAEWVASYFVDIVDPTITTLEPWKQKCYRMAWKLQRMRKDIDDYWKQQNYFGNTENREIL